MLADRMGEYRIDFIADTELVRPIEEFTNLLSSLYSVDAIDVGAVARRLDQITVSHER